MRLLRNLLLLISALTAASAQYAGKLPDLSGLPPQVQESIRQSYGIRRTTTVGHPSQRLPTPPPMSVRRCRDQPRLRDQEQPKCSSGRSKWTYNSAAGRCEWFPHYGCQLDSGNVFSSRRDCETACLRGVQNPCSVARCEPVSQFYKSECIPASDSICVDRILARYADIPDPEARRAAAQWDIEVGCQAPVARCLNSGINMRLPMLETQPVLDWPSVPAYCRLPPDRGFCPNDVRGRLSRVYFYIARQNECKFMVHFGCGGNRNRFASLAQCHNACAL